MGLNGIRNSAKLRRISALIGRECIYAAARYFEDQRVLIAFGKDDTCFAVNLKAGTSEPYEEEGRLLRPSWSDQLGRYCGVRSEHVMTGQTVNG